MDTQNSLFSEKFKKFFENTLHYICTGRGQFVGCFAKKIKIAFTYSHWEKPFAHPNSELFTKNSKSPLIMFAPGEDKFGIISEKFSKNFLVTTKVLFIISKSFFVLRELTAELPSLFQLLHLFGIRRYFCTP